MSSNKLFLKILLGTFLFAGCQAEDLCEKEPETSKEKTFKENWVESVGDIDPEQTWTTTRLCNLTVKIEEKGTFTVRVYDSNPYELSDSRRPVLQAEFTSVQQGESSFKVDIPFTQNECYVELVTDYGDISKPVNIENNVIKASFSDYALEESSAKNTRAITKGNVPTLNFDRSFFEQFFSFNVGTSGRIETEFTIGEYTIDRDKDIYLIFNDVQYETATIGDLGYQEKNSKNRKVLWKSKNFDVTSQMKGGVIKSHSMWNSPSLIFINENFKYVKAQKKVIKASNSNNKYLYVFGKSEWEPHKVLININSLTNPERFCQIGKPIEYKGKYYQVVGIFRNNSYNKDALNIENFAYIYAITDSDASSGGDTTPGGNATPGGDTTPGGIGTGGGIDAETGSSFPHDNACHTVICEDLGSVGDRDFNDIILEIEFVNGRKKATLTPLAAGGTLPAYILYNNVNYGEIHSKFVPSGTPVINGYKKGKPGTPITIELTDEQTFLDIVKRLTIRVDQGNHSYVNIDFPEKGQAPHMISVPCKWTWPKENICIEDAYSDFKKWNNNHNVATDWYKRANTEMLVD